MVAIMEMMMVVVTKMTVMMIIRRVLFWLEEENATILDKTTWEKWPLGIQESEKPLAQLLLNSNFPLPLPLFNVEFRKPPFLGKRLGATNNIELGGGGGVGWWNLVVSVFTLSSLELNFLNSFIHDCSSVVAVKQLFAMPWFIYICWSWCSNPTVELSCHYWPQLMSSLNGRLQEVVRPQA